MHITGGGESEQFMVGVFIYLFVYLLLFMFTDAIEMC